MVFPVRKALRGQSTTMEIERWMIDNDFADPSHSCNEANHDNLRTMSANTVRMNGKIFSKYLENARAMEEIDEATADATAPPPPPLTRPRSHVLDSEKSEDGYDDAPAPEMEKVSGIAAAQAEPTTSSSPLDAYDELQQVIEEDKYARHMQAEENDGWTYEPDEEKAPPIRSFKRTSVVKARSAKAAATTWCPVLRCWTHQATAAHIFPPPSLKLTLRLPRKSVPPSFHLRPSEGGLAVQHVSLR